ncbi:MAG: tRNA (N6-isopentenyl adenosine(37)-C2)-methylthiotransferase MiaB [Actinomycetota bacterium]|nr:tRNA (N6-isopentenyl adenosine(37)-C2)-methylthiotransferase MiaB [Actinomycetota bacterium]
MSDTAILGMPVVREPREARRAGDSYFIRTFGCQMNEHDSERISGLLEADGMIRAENAAEADVVVLNTCTIRENADQRLYGYLGSLKADKQKNPGMRIAIGGCTAQKDKEIVRERAPWVDVVFGTHNIHRVVDLLDRVDEWGPVTEIWEESSSPDDAPSFLPTRRETAHSAWVTITTGCNNSCTFCIVPIVRGPEISRRPGDVIREIQRLADDGVIEITLLGQNVNSYGRDLDLNGRQPLFADLLRRAGEVDGIGRIRYTSPHPKDIKDDVARAMAETPSVAAQLHLPLQSGSDRILSLMHRGYTAKRFLDKLAMARDVIPDLSVSTDIIVGFPGESDDDFAATLAVVEESRFDSAFMFQFSPRPGTPAADMADHVPAAVVQERFDRLVAMQNDITYERNQARVGMIERVLTEGPSRRNPQVATTRSEGNRIVHVDGVHEPGQFLDVRITRAAPHYLEGALI